MKNTITIDSSRCSSGNASQPLTAQASRPAQASVDVEAFNAWFEDEWTRFEDKPNADRIYCKAWALKAVKHFGT